eukprot:452613-Hanusia_phi.AAC.6
MISSKGILTFSLRFLSCCPRVNVCITRGLARCFKPSSPALLEAPAPPGWRTAHRVPSGLWSLQHAGQTGGEREDSISTCSELDTSALDPSELRVEELADASIPDSKHLRAI